MTQRDLDIAIGRIAIALVGWARVSAMVEQRAPSLDACLNRNAAALEQQHRWWLRLGRVLRRQLARGAPTCTLWTYSPVTMGFRLKCWPHLLIGDYERWLLTQ